ncbi:hypothetical protein CIK05_00220 [Bdellovibrio sp. qaytius]|nr:hypothetical protein CIK05_00220 [Bdellovibrio sp. qaytius]
MKYTLKNLIVLSFFIFVGCQKAQQEKTEVPVVAVSETAKVSIDTTTASSTAVTSPAVEKNWLAKLLQQTNQVEFRKRNQNVWNQAEQSLAFLRYDALQTKNSSTAEVIYQSGSTLDVKENTLIIFDEDPGQKKKAEDRIIIKSGQLTGKTKTELWVFTDSGLIQIKAKKGAASKLAEAHIIVKKDRAITVKVNQGTAEIVYKKENEFTRVAVAEKADINLKPSTEVTSGLQVNEDKIQELANAQIKTVATAQADLSIESPADNALVNDEEIEIRGRLTGAGAKLLINGQLAEISDGGIFTKKIKLQAGTNLVVFQIVRSDGTVKFVKRNVRYQPR